VEVLLINGSPHKNGNTFSALEIVRNVLNKEKLKRNTFT